MDAACVSELLPQGMPPLTSSGIAFDARYLAHLRDSSPIINAAAAMRQRMSEDGYLYLPGALDRDLVLAARREVTRRLYAAGHLNPRRDPMDAVAAPASKLKFLPELAHDNAPLLSLLYDGAMMDIFTRLLATPVRYFDYTWFRAVAPGPATRMHCDSVYMNRGTHNLYTAWTPIGDAPYDLGGLVLLECSHRNQRLRDTYGSTDVDAYCANRTGPAALDSWAKNRNGALGKDPNRLRRSIVRDVDTACRWLTADYHAGDVVIFSIFTVHGGTDNHSDRFRLSTDTRYQPAGEPADERWIGSHPLAHGPASKRGKIC